MKAAKTITELAQEIQRQADAKEDFIVATPKIHVSTSTDDGDMAMSFTTDEGVFDGSMLSLAREQLGIQLAVPKAFFERLRVGVPSKNSRAARPANPTLLDHTLNTLLESEPRNRMVRTLDGNVRAWLSNRYRMLDNLDLAEAILPTIAGMDRALIEGEITDLKLYIKVLLPTIQAEVPEVGDIVQAGFIVKNSEVGHGTLSVQPMVYTLRCKNGMILPEYSQKRYHVGRAWASGEEEAYKVFSDETLRKDDEAFFAKVTDVVKAAADETKFADIVARLGEAATTTPMDDVQEGVTRVVKKYALTEGEGKGILNHLAAGGNLSLYGLHSAITEFAQSVDSYDRSVELEELGGEVIVMPKAEWRAIAVTA